MQNKYYDEEEFNNIFYMIGKRPLESKGLLEEYMAKYPKDYRAKAQYILLLETLNRFDEANKAFRKFKNLAYRDDAFRHNPGKFSQFIYLTSYARMRYLAHYERYQEVLDYYKKIKGVFGDQEEIRYMLFYCSAKLGLIDPSSIPGVSYRYLQAFKYNEERFRAHIKKHQMSYNQGLERPNEYIFASNFPFDAVIEEIKKIIPAERKLCCDFSDDVYFFKYDNCGYVSGKTTHYFQVICFNGTNELFTMHPVLDDKGLTVADLNYLQMENVTTLDVEDSRRSHK